MCFDNKVSTTTITIPMDKSTSYTPYTRNLYGVGNKVFLMKRKDDMNIILYSYHLLNYDYKFSLHWLGLISVEETNQQYSEYSLYDSNHELISKSTKLIMSGYHANPWDGSKIEDNVSFLDQHNCQDRVKVIVPIIFATSWFDCCDSDTFAVKNFIIPKPNVIRKILSNKQHQDYKKVFDIIRNNIKLIPNKEK